jgi:hypothetical protein
LRQGAEGCESGGVVVEGEEEVVAYTLNPTP